jgi:hypothetical protein
MAVKLFIKLQTPTIELKVSAKDAAGNKDSFTVGFKRYDLATAQVKLEQLQNIFEAVSKETALDSKELNTFIKNEIVFLKQLKLDLEDENGNSKELSVADTRTVKPNESLWETADECLAVLLDMYLGSAPYRLSLITALQKALLNSDYSEAEVKN